MFGNSNSLQLQNTASSRNYKAQVEDNSFSVVAQASEEPPVTGNETYLPLCEPASEEERQARATAGINGAIFLVTTGASVVWPQFRAINQAARIAIAAGSALGIAGNTISAEQQERDRTTGCIEIEQQ
jgi:hypothetical protein